MRIRAWIPQLLLLLAIAAIAGWLIANMVDNLSRRGIMVGFDFLDRVARFPISESILAYEPTDSFGWAIIVGLGNTLFLSLVVAAAATVLAGGVALARRSSHPFAYGLSTGFVEAVRNTPLVVQLLFWYAAVTFGLPRSDSAFNPLPGVFLTDRGLYLPRIGLTGTTAPLLFIIAAGLLAAAVLAWRRRGTGAGARIARRVLVATALLAAVAWIAGGVAPAVEWPALGRFNFMGGLTLTPEFVAVFVGLTLYSTAFAAEIIRSGIDAVPRGQWEAGRAIGLSETRTLRFVILPQALRIMIPPMTSQYVTIIKNSTLALVVGFPELNFVTATTINQTGQAIEGILILMAIFLIISLTASLFMNWYNRRLALVAR